VQLVVLRGGSQQSLTMTAVEQRSDFDSVSSMADAEKNLVPELGILGIEIDSRVAAMAKGLRGPNGIIVAARASGAAGDIPILAGDVIRSVNNRQILTLQGLKDAVHGVSPGNPLTLQIQREGRLMYVSFTLD
jgi:S1-C subfamily serine protease